VSQETWTYLLQLITFVAVLYFIYRFFGRSIGKLLGDRTRRISESLRQSAESQRRAQEITQETDRQLAQARTEARGITESARRAAEVQRQALLEQAQRDVEGVSRRARDVIERERQAAIDELRREAGRLAVLAATRVIEQSLQQGNAGRQLADRTIAEVGG